MAEQEGGRVGGDAVGKEGKGHCIGLEHLWQGISASFGIQWESTRGF